MVHVTPRLGAAGGGVWQFVKDLADEQAAAGLRVAITGLQAETELAIPNATIAPAKPAMGLRHGPLWTLAYSPDLGRNIDQLTKRSRVVHAHGGLRMWPNVQVRRAAARYGRPVLLSPHGSLYPWMLLRNRVRKFVMRTLFDRRSLGSVDRLHATCQQEAQFIRDAGLRQEIEVIPAGVRPLVEGDATRVMSKMPQISGRRVALFVGIFDRKKGLPRLVEAWSKLGESAGDWVLLLAGPDQGGHTREVRELINQHGLEKQILLIGPHYGQNKSDLYAAAELFVLATDWENFGIVVGEALSAGVPVLTTINTPWDWLPGEQAGWFVEPSVDAIEAALRQALAKSPADLASMGERGRAVVKARYRWERVVEQFSRVYDNARAAEA